MSVSTAGGAGGATGSGGLSVGAPVTLTTSSGNLQQQQHQQQLGYGNKVVHHLINQIILEFVTPSETPSPSTRAHKGLIKYLRNPCTVDIVYSKIMDRVRADKMGNRTLILNCITLLKTYLFTYVPKPETLVQLERFCLYLPAENESLAKSIKYVRALIANRLLQSTKEEARLALTEINTTSPIDRSSTSSLDKDVLTNSPTQDPSTASRLSDVVDTITTNHLVSNVLQQRTCSILAKLPQKSTSTVSLNLFYDTFRGVGESSWVVDQKDFLRIHDAAETRDKIMVVSLEKKKEETKMYKESGQLTVRRKGVQLFHYKYYKEQSPLNLTEEERQEVYNAVTNSDDHESCLIGSKILIKLVMDLFCAEEHKKAQKLLLDLISKMLDSGVVERKLHAFNLLFNIAVHSNLITEVSPAEADEKKVISPLVATVLEYLYTVLKEMLNGLLSNKEADAKVWGTALNCLLFFIAKKGKVDRQRLFSLREDVIPAIIKNLWDNLSYDKVMRELVAMLVNIIYQKQTFNIELFERCCTINFVLDVYRRIQSVEACENLFTVIYDYTIYRFVNKKLDPGARQQAELFLSILKQKGAALYLADIFKYASKSIVESLSRKLSLDSYHSIKLDKEFALSVLRGFKKLARTYLEMDPEYKTQMLITLNANKHGTSSAAASMDLLSKLILSTVQKETRDAQEWLLELLLTSFDESRSLAPSVVSALEAIINSLLSSSNPHTRRIYILVTEQIILALKAKSHQAMDEDTLLSTITNVINNNFGRAIKTGEKNEANLMLIFDIIMSFIMIYFPGTTSSKSHVEDEETYGDTPSALFPNGRALVSQTLLQKIDIEIFSHLFTHMPPRQHARVTLLILIIDHCKNKQHPTLQKIGGLSFFRSLLTNRDYPDIVYHASRFLIEQFQSEQPEQFQAFLTQLVNKAQQTNNEQLLGNYYLQIRAITGM